MILDPALHSQANPPSFPLLLFWLLLSAAGSAMLLATTNQLTGDVAVVPFLWVVPLSLYLLTFILCFDSDRWYRRGLFGFLLALAAPVAVSLLYQSVFIDLRAQIIAYGFVLFVCCMNCHGELARLKPLPQHLTLFYLTLATGGALGGLLVAVAAPLLMSHYFEYHAALFACAALIVAAWLREAFLRGGPATFSVRPYALAAFVVVAAPLINWSMTQQPFREATWAAPFDALASAWSLLRGSIGRQLAANLGWAPFATAGGVIVLIALSALIDADRQRRGEPLAMRWVGAGLALLALGATLLIHIGGTREAARHSIRNFYGVVHVEEYDDYIAVSDKPTELARQLGMSWWPYHEEINLGPVTRLVHGRIIHGVQFKDPKLAQSPTIYYGQHSGVGLALTRHPRRLGSAPLSPWEGAGVRAEQASAPRLPLNQDELNPLTPTALTLTLSQKERGPEPLHVGVVGLGAGCLAVYARPGDRLRFYEINPAVLELAQRHFTYLRDCPAAVTTHLGDGRIVLERQLREQGSQQFDVLILDAFSGDAIPIHLLTAEAVDLYFKHLKTDGLLAIHISNRFVNLEPVCEGLQRHLARNGPCEAVKIDSPPDPRRALVGAWWVVLTRNRAWVDDGQVAAAASAFGDRRPRWARSPVVLPADLADLRRLTGNDQLQPGDVNRRYIVPTAARREPILWTDDYASLWEVLSF